MVILARGGGSLEDLRAARAATTAPLLAKGFFTEEVDLLQLQHAGADVVGTPERIGQVLSSRRKPS